MVEGANSGRPLQQRVGDIKAQKTNGHCACDRDFDYKFLPAKLKVLLLNAVRTCYLTLPSHP